jgi:carbon-monoxide dehydrogenase small subunit
VIDKRRTSFTVNGVQKTVEIEGRKLLSDVLRQDLRLTGTHVGCEHGVCGACTVIMDGKTVRSCLTFGVQAEGAEIETIEGLAETPKNLHPVQRAFWEKHGLQCGFCTPGMVLAAKALLEENPNPTEEEIQEGMGGNICRCTGYVFIVESVKAAAKAMQREGA